MYAERNMSILDWDFLTHFLPAVVCKAYFWHCRLFLQSRAVCFRSVIPPIHLFQLDSVLVGSESARVCFGGGRRVVAFLPLLPHSVKSPYTDVLQTSMRPCGSAVFLNKALFLTWLKYFESFNFSPLLLIHKCCLT